MKNVTPHGIYCFYLSKKQNIHKDTVVRAMFLTRKYPSLQKPVVILPDLPLHVIYSKLF